MNAKKNTLLYFFCYLIVIFYAIPSLAVEYLLPLPGNGLIGEGAYSTYLKPKQKTLQELARTEKLGYYEILAMNPNINPEHFYAWQKINISHQYILPDAPQNGIVINTAELRAYFYPPNSNKVYTYPIAIGMLGDETPLGHFSIIQKIKNPKWYVPVSILHEMAKQGMYLPKIMDAGPDNPLGNYAIRLSARSYLLHGTNTPATIGRRASAGCLHFYPEDIQELFEHVDSSTPVTIVDQPYKAAWSGNVLYFQAYEPLREDRTRWLGNYKPIYTEVINTAIQKTTKPVQVNWNRVRFAVENANGKPVAIARLSTQIT